MIRMPPPSAAGLTAVAALLILSLQPAAAAPSPQETAGSPGGEEVLATVGETRITVEEFRREMANRGGSVPGSYATPEQRRALLDEMVRERALSLAARAAGYDRDPEFVATVEKMLARRFLRDQLEDRLEAAPVTDAEVESFYRSRQEEFLQPARLRAAWVLVAVSPKASEEEVARLADRAAEARAAAEKLPTGERALGPVAQQYSDDAATRYTGGELGWLYEAQADRYRWGPELVRQAFELPAPGAISPLTRGEAGFYFLKLVEREEARPTPLERVRSGIRARLMKQRNEEARARFYERVLASHPVAVDEARLGAIAPLAPTERPALAPPPLPGG